jgi:hypothetical protein
MGSLAGTTRPFSQMNRQRDGPGIPGIDAISRSFRFAKCPI